MHLTSGVNSTSSSNGSLLVDGGIGVAGNVNIDGGLTVLGNESVDISPSGADVYIKPSVGGTIEIRPQAAGHIDNMIIGANDPAAGTFDTVSVISTSISTSSVTGALTVAGGVGIQGSIYNAVGGQPAENYLLYTPIVHITAGVPPPLPRVGDVWIDSTIPAYLQYIKDGTSTFWIQVGAV